MFDLADAGELGFDADRLARIAPFLSDAYIANGRLPNAQLVVARDGRPVHYTSLGKMGDDGRELRDDALFRIASMTKPVASNSPTSRFMRVAAVRSPSRRAPLPRRCASSIC